MEYAYGNSSLEAASLAVGQWRSIRNRRYIWSSCCSLTPPDMFRLYFLIHHGHVQLCIARPNMNFPLPPTHKIRPMVIWIVHFWQRGSSLRQVMATATTVGKSRESSIGSAAIMVTMISMLGKSCASVGAIRKVRFEEKPDSIYRAVSCMCPDWSVSWSVFSR